MKNTRNRLAAATTIAVLALTAGAGPAAAYEYGGPTRTFWCSVWPSFCR